MDSKAAARRSWLLTGSVARAGRELWEAAGKALSKSRIVEQRSKTSLDLVDLISASLSWGLIWA
jgi:hypothetical protein